MSCLLVAWAFFWSAWSTYTASLRRATVGGSYWWNFFPGIVTLGVGMAVTVAPLTTTVVNAVGADFAGVASGVNNAVARASSLLAIAIFGIVMAQVFDSRLAALLHELSLSPSVVNGIEQQRARLAGIVLPPGIDTVQQQSVHRAIGGAFVAGFRRVMAVCAGLALLSALCAAWFIDRDRRTR